MTVPSGKTPSVLIGRGVLSLPVSYGLECTGLAILTAPGVDRARPGVVGARVAARLWNGGPHR